MIAAPPSSDRVNGDDSDSDQVDLDADDPNPAVADVDALSLEVGRRLPTRLAGVFLFWPLLARLQFDRLVAKADYPGSKMIPATQALLSLLTLKLLDKERRSHIDDFNCDEALGLFAGLNVLPKKSFATDYSYRTQRCHQERLLQGWVKRLAPHCFPRRRRSRSTSTPFLIAAKRPCWTIIICRGEASPGLVFSRFSHKNGAAACSATRTRT